MRKKYIVGNWKMNHLQNDIQHFFEVADLNDKKIQTEFWIAPQFIHLHQCLSFKTKFPKLLIGAQNCSSHIEGAHTGEVSPKALASIGADFVIIGHSERRAIYLETNELINAKVQCALANNLKIILCVGENLEEREKNLTLSVVKNQLDLALKNIDHTKFQKNILIAYEPVWAIGTGKTATPAQAQEVHKFIRQSLPWSGENTIILYGGSVKPNNIAELVNEADIDGALVGGASLKGEDFYSLCKNASI